MRRPILLSTIALVSACGGKTPPRPPGPQTVEAAARCPNTMWQAGELRPASIEILNRSADSVSVWLDRCTGHTHVGDLGAGDSVVVALPSGAASYQGKLRFITFRGERKAITIELTSPLANPHIRLEVPERAVECPLIFVDGKLFDAPLSTLPRDRIEQVEYLPSPATGECPRVNVRLRGGAASSSTIASGRLKDSL